MFAGILVLNRNIQLFAQFSIKITAQYKQFNSYVFQIFIYA